MVCYPGIVSRMIAYKLLGYMFGKGVYFADVGIRFLLFLYYHTNQPLFAIDDVQGMKCFKSGSDIDGRLIDLNSHIITVMLSMYLNSLH